MNPKRSTSKSQLRVLAGTCELAKRDPNRKREPGSNNPLAGRYRDFAARLLMSKGGNEPEAVHEPVTASGSRRNF
jgi:hypothetical protein